MTVAGENVKGRHGRPRDIRQMPLWVKLTVIPLLTLFTTSLFLGFGLWKADPKWVTCEVSSVATKKGNRNTVSAWSVQISTTNCGPLSYSQRVRTEEDAEAIASSFQLGELYEFRQGIPDQMALRSWMTPSVQEYRLVENE